MDKGFSRKSTMHIQNSRFKAHMGGHLYVLNVCHLVASYGCYVWFVHRPDYSNRFVMAGPGKQKRKNYAQHKHPAGFHANSSK